VTDTTKTDETIRWRADPSWAHFIWLYLFSLMAAFRGVRLLLLGQGGASVWLGGAVALLVCVAILRRWVEYVLTLRLIIDICLRGVTEPEVIKTRIESQRPKSDAPLTKKGSL